MKTNKAAAVFLAALLILAAFPPRSSAMGAAPLCEALIEPRLRTDTLYGFVEGAAITYSEDAGYELVGLDGKALTERAYDLIRPCSSGLYVAALNGKYGALNQRGKAMIAFLYDSLTDFVDGYAVSVKNGVTQIINLAGNVGSPLQYSSHELLPDGLARFEQSGLWGLASVHGEILARPVYDEISDFSDDRAVVKRYGRSGAIDKAGVEIIPAEYEFIGQFENGVTYAQDGSGLYGLIGKDGKRLTPFKYGVLQRHEDVMTAVIYDGEGRFGFYFVDFTGEEYLSPYEPMWRFSNNLWVVRNGDLYGIVNTNGELVLPVEYDEIALPFEQHGNLADVRKGDVWGLIDCSAKVIVPAEYGNTGDDRLLVFSQPGEIVAIQGGKITVLDLTGNVRLTIDGWSASKLSDGMRAVRGPNGLWGYLDENGEIAIPFKYTEATDFLDGFAAVLDSDSTHADTAYIIDKAGKITGSNALFPHTNLGNGFFAATRWGDSPPSVEIIDKTGKRVLTHERAAIYYFDYGQDFYIVENGKHLYGIIDCFGRLVLPAEYERIISSNTPDFDYYWSDTLFSSGLYWVLKDGKWGLIKLTSRADIPSDWAKAHVERAISAGIVPESFTKAYSTPATRAEFCELAVALYEKIKGAEIPVRVKFTDTDDINVEKMAGLNVVSGTGGNKFSPDDPITREQAAVILSKLIDALGGKYAASGAESFSDADLISEWALPAVLRVRSLGVMSGVGDGKFGPKGQYTREQCITTLLKVYDLVKK